MEPHESAKFWIEGVITPLVAFIGIFGNILAITVLCSKKLEVVRSFRQLFIQLACFDTLILIVTLLFCPGNWSQNYRK